MVFFTNKKRHALLALVLTVILLLSCALVACNNDSDDLCKNGHTFVDGKCTVCGATDPDYKPQPQKQEIVYKGKTGQGSDKFMGDPQDVYWVDASVQKPDSYAKIVGFKLTAKLVKTDYYGGGKETQTFACGMVLATKGAHEPNEYVFTYPNEQTPTFDLSTKTVAAFGVGEAGWLISMVFSNGISTAANATAGTVLTLTYSGDNAVFAEGDPILTIVSFLGEFEYQSVEWILGEPEQVEEKPWDRVETDEYLDVSTLPEGKQNNGNNYVDISVPKTGKSSYPVVLWIHGGGYITGSRKNCLLDTTKQYMLAQGYAWVSADYTLTKTEEKNGQTVYTEGGMPQMLYDLKTAVRFLRANASKYKLNTDFIVAMGESAGAGLALLMGTSNGLTNGYEDLTMGWADQSSDVQAVYTVCAPTCFTGDEFINNMYAYIGSQFNDYFGTDQSKKDQIIEWADMWSATELITEDVVPMYLAFSKEDTTVPQSHYNAIKDALEIYFTAEEMEQRGIVLVNYNKGGHVDRGTFDTYTAYYNLVEWCNVQRDKILNAK